MIQPTLDMAETWSKDLLVPMIRSKDPKSRDSNNTLLHKKFAGGHITMGERIAIYGFNSPPS